ncbi:hypothetical protein B0T25DRAFT_531744 [Lasiosphaeria hispida]|uniref:Uncharacterized protein n=1 Tax=Lasiosphaeria hispida TaxID=260671 RepID=A0AAJ0HPL4_9PEZI|nr:hypothetical protein B0T25DRAFT_531744 [Lasiosphaeria hispida]
MDFPAPPSFSDPLLYPPNLTPSSPAPSSRQQHQAPSAREQPGSTSHSQPQQSPPPPQQQQQQQQQQQLQQQQLQHQQPPLFLMNGMNGGNMPGAMVGLPTPAGHQAELNYIYGMVEELSRQLAQNQRALEDVVSGVGRVRSRARSQSLGNEELINAAADDVRAQEPNLDALVSLLTEALEKAKCSRDANAALLSQYASVVASMLKQFHDYKAKHVADVAAWHRNYRTQLAEARAENCRLREQIWEMQAHAGSANELLRMFRARYDEDEARWERRVDAKAHRQELRFWKRLALPMMPDDDPCWSDDDDLIDTAEKRRLRELQKQLADQAHAAAAAAAAGGALGDLESMSGGRGEMGERGDDMGCDNNGLQQGSRPGTLTFPMSLVGGVPMQRSDSGSMMPIPPPRPSSAASSTGSTGQ